MLKIINNPDTETYQAVREAVNAASGFCPCRLEHTPDTKCPCKDFREQESEGLCHCGLLQKVSADA